VTDITFFKTGHHYDSYDDFWRLVTLAQFPIIKLSDLDVSQPGVFIGAPHNGEWVHIDNQSDRVRNAHIVLWNIERPSGSAGSVGQYGEANRKLIYRRQVDEVWVSDRELAQETHLEYTVLGSHPQFGRPGGHKTYDMTHMSYETGRRQSIYKHFTREKTGFNCWPPRRDRVLQASKFALNVHQDQHPFIEPLRLALFAAYGLPTLSETVYDAYPYNGDVLVFAEFDHLVERLNQMLADDYEQWRQMGRRMRELMTVEFEFGTMVRKKVDERVGDWR